MLEIWKCWCWGWIHLWNLAAQNSVRKQSRFTLRAAIRVWSLPQYFADLSSRSATFWTGMFSSIQFVFQYCILIFSLYLYLLCSCTSYSTAQRCCAETLANALSEPKWQSWVFKAASKIGGIAAIGQIKLIPFNVNDTHAYVHAYLRD